MLDFHQNKREYFRVPLEKPLCVSVKIVKFKGKSVTSNHGRICIHDISPGGLCFRSNLKFPVNLGMMLEFTAIIMGNEHKLYGDIVRDRHIEEYVHEYGVKFSHNDVDEVNMLQVVNELAIALTKRQASQFVHRCSFCKKDPYACLKAIADSGRKEE